VPALVERQGHLRLPRDELLSICYQTHLITSLTVPLALYLTQAPTHGFQLARAVVLPSYEVPTFLKFTQSNDRHPLKVLKVPYSRSLYTDNQLTSLQHNAVAFDSRTMSGYNDRRPSQGRDYRERSPARSAGYDSRAPRRDRRDDRASGYDDFSSGQQRGEYSRGGRGGRGGSRGGQRGYGGGRGGGPSVAR